MTNQRGYFKPSSTAGYRHSQATLGMDSGRNLVTAASGPCMLVMAGSPQSALQTPSSEYLISGRFGGWGGGSRVSMEPPFGLDLVLRSTEDRLNELPSLAKELRKLLLWLTLAALAKSRSKTDLLTGRARSFTPKR